MFINFSCWKYSGDQDDKQWLHEHHHMPATGGRTYLLLVDDIKELAQTDEYRWVHTAAEAPGAWVQLATFGSKWVDESSLIYAL